MFSAFEGLFEKSYNPEYGDWRVIINGLMKNRKKLVVARKKKSHNNINHFIKLLKAESWEKTKFLPVR